MAVGHGQQLGGSAVSTGWRAVHTALAEKPHTMVSDSRSYNQMSPRCITQAPELPTHSPGFPSNGSVLI